MRKKNIKKVICSYKSKNNINIFTSLKFVKLDISQFDHIIKKLITYFRLMEKFHYLEYLQINIKKIIICIKNSLPTCVVDRIND